MTELDSLLTRNRERLQGVQGWADVARLGRTNLRRLRELLAEDAMADLASQVSLTERREWSLAAEALRELEAQATEDKPCLVRFRVESFQAGAEVHVYGGDTPGSLVPGWVSGRVVTVVKAHRPEWNDGSPNAGYYWEVSIKAAILPNVEVLRCSTSEPRVLHSRDYRWLLKQSDPEFFRIFTDNAQRTWSPLWCLGAQLPKTNVRDWFR